MGGRLLLAAPQRLLLMIFVIALTLLHALLTFVGAVDYDTGMSYNGGPTQPDFQEKTINLRTGPAIVVKPSYPVLSNPTINRNIFPHNKWGSLPYKNLNLIAYDDSSQIIEIKNRIIADGGRLVSYIPENIVLAFALWSTATNIAFAMKNVFSGTYNGACKVVPELSPLLDNTSPVEDVEPIINSMVTRSVFDNVQYGILVEFVPDVTIDMLKSAAQLWPSLLVENAGGDYKRYDDPCWPNIVPPNVGVTLTVYLCKKDLPASILWFSELSVSRVVYPMLRSQNMNLAASELLQTDSISQNSYSKLEGNLYGIDPYEMTKDKWPYWLAGLQGQEEIVGLGDSGVDVDHCHFQDPAYADGYFTQMSGLSNVSSNSSMSYWRIPDHRKVVQYAFKPGSGDQFDFQGHGTKCAGSIAGAPLTDESLRNSSIKLTVATGVAPAARLSVVDFARMGDKNRLEVPNNVELNYLPVHAAVGGFILSDSWGSVLETEGYNDKARGYDMFLWKNPDFISFASAGNFGMNTSVKYKIISPAIAKNVVAVGAGYRIPTSAGLRTGIYTVRTEIFGLPFARALIVVENTVLPLLASTVSNNTSAELTLADPIDACMPLINPATVERKVVFVQRGGCSSYHKGLHVMAAGGAAVIIVQNSSDQPVVPALDEIEQSEIKVPMSMTYKDIGDILINILRDGAAATLSGSTVPKDSKVVASFSSWGPTSGDSILSALSSQIYSSGTLCHFDVYSGTSAATPAAAGTVAIMRQYLRAGFYPTGTPKSAISTPFLPSGMLLKALLIAGAKSMQGGVAEARGELLGPPPDGYQGWGRLSMAGSLPLEGFTDPRVRLQVLDRGQFIRANQSTRVGGIVATGTGPISIVLAYYDYPADLNAVTTLVNNLTLIVTVNDRNYTGNNDEDAVSPVPDSINTVEKVLLKSPPPGAVVGIIVEAPSLPSLILDPTTPQRWAVAVVGHFSGYLQSSLNPVWVKWLNKMPPSPQPPSNTKLPPRPPRAPNSMPRPPPPRPTRPPPSPPPFRPFLSPFPKPTLPSSAKRPRSSPSLPPSPPFPPPSPPKPPLPPSNHLLPPPTPPLSPPSSPLSLPSSPTSPPTPSSPPPPPPPRPSPSPPSPRLPPRSPPPSPPSRPPYPNFFSQSPPIPPRFPSSSPPPPPKPPPFSTSLTPSPFYLLPSPPNPSKPPTLFSPSPPTTPPSPDLYQKSVFSPPPSQPSTKLSPNPHLPSPPTPLLPPAAPPPSVPSRPPSRTPSLPVPKPSLSPPSSPRIRSFPSPFLNPSPPPPTTPPPSSPNPPPPQPTPPPFLMPPPSSPPTLLLMQSSSLLSRPSLIQSRMYPPPSLSYSPPSTNNPPSSQSSQPNPPPPPANPPLPPNPRPLSPLIPPPAPPSSPPSPPSPVLLPPNPLPSPPYLLPSAPSPPLLPPLTPAPPPRTPLSSELSPPSPTPISPATPRLSLTTLASPPPKVPPPPKLPQLSTPPHPQPSPSSASPSLPNLLPSPPLHPVSPSEVPTSANPTPAPPFSPLSPPFPLPSQPNPQRYELSHQPPLPSPTTSPPSHPPSPPSHPTPPTNIPASPPKPPSSPNSSPPYPSSSPPYPSSPLPYLALPMPYPSSLPSSTRSPLFPQPSPSTPKLPLSKPPPRSSLFAQPQAQPRRPALPHPPSSSEPWGPRLPSREEPPRAPRLPRSNSPPQRPPSPP